MTIYIIEFLLILFLKPLLNFLNHKKQERAEKAYLFLVFLILALVSGLRARNIGSDTQTYRWIYESISNSSSFKEALKRSSISSAPVYVFIQYVLSRFNLNPQIYMLINSAVIAIGFENYIRRESCNYVYSCIMFMLLCLYFQSMNGTRQFMAIALLINSYSLLKYNLKSIKGWGLFLLSIGIHNTSISFLLAYLAILLKRKLRNYNDALKLSLLVSIIIFFGFNFFTKIISLIFPYFNIYINGSNSAQIFENEGNGRIAFVYLLLLLILIFVSFVLKKSGMWNAKSIYARKRVNSISIYIDYYTCTVCFILGVVFSKNILFNRILWPFLSVSISFLPNIMSSLNRNNRIIISTFCILLLLVYWFIFLVQDKSGIVPYRLFVEL